MLKIEHGNTTKMKVTNEIVYLAADDEQSHAITHAEITLDAQGYIVDERVPIRIKGDFIEGDAKLVEYIDVVPRQVVGAPASLIPFLAHDEANRGSHGNSYAMSVCAASSA